MLVAAKKDEASPVITDRHARQQRLVGNVVLGSTPASVHH
jgi:hypothetical protein